MGKATSLSVTSPKRVGGDFSALQLPIGIEPAMIQDLIQRMHSELLGYRKFPHSKERPRTDETRSHQPR